MFEQRKHKEKVNKITLVERFKSLPMHAMKYFLLAIGKLQTCIFAANGTQDL